MVMVKTWAGRLNPIARLKGDPYRIKIGPVELNSEDRVRHTHIVGATGSGKSVLLEHLIMADIKNGLGVFVIDPKGDRTFYEKIRNYAASVGRENDIHLISANYPKETSCWNPCRLGDVAELHTKLLKPWIFSEPFYEKSCQNALLHALNSLSLTNEPIFLPDVRAKLKDSKVPEEHVRGLELDLSNLIESEWKEILMCEASTYDRTELDFLEVVRRRQIVFLDLPAEGKSLQSQLVGKLFLQELMLISGLKKLYPVLRSAEPFMVYVDEFDSFANDSFITFLNKARSSNFAIHVAHQTLSDLRKISPEFQKQVLGNTNVRFVFRQDDPEDAELWSGFFGTKTALKRTTRVSGGVDTGEASVRESREFSIHPDQIKFLGTGVCIFSAKSRRRLSVVSIPAPSQVPPYSPLFLQRKASVFLEPHRTNDIAVSTEKFLKGGKHGRS